MKIEHVHPKKRKQQATTDDLKPGDVFSFVAEIDEDGDRADVYLMSGKTSFFSLVWVDTGEYSTENHEGAVVIYDAVLKLTKRES